MMNLETKLRTAADDMVNGLKTTATNCILDGKIAAQEKIIDTMTREIGTLAVHALDQGTVMPPEIMERYEAVQAARDAIREAKTEKQAGKSVCPECGAKTESGMKFCGACGARMENED